MSDVRVRIAPSPTGFLHVGNLRTILYNYLFARNKGGVLVLRIEDTDRERFVQGAIESLLKTLRDLDLQPDEGPITQSERLEIYRKYADQLLEKGSAYRCFCSRERLDEMRKQQQLAKMPTKYDRHCCDLSEEDVQKKLDAGESCVIRMKIPEGKTTFDDIVRKSITIDNAEIDDQVIIKSDGFPTYHLGVVVDDHEMNISHIIRGEEWLSSVPKHIILYQMFGWEVPKFAHLPLLLNADKSKLSKRQGDVAVEDYLDKGYLPEALINFVALLGYNPKGDQEIYGYDELVELFDLSKVNPSGAVFDVDKLNWMNSHYIRQKSVAELVVLCQPFLDRAGKSVDPDLLERIVAVEQERLVRLDEIVDMVDLYIQEPEYPDPQILVWKKADAKDSGMNIGNMIEFLKQDLDLSSIELVEKAIKEYIKDKGLQNGNVLWPTRVALSGQTASPSPFELIWALGQEESLKRLNKALQALS